MKNFNIEDPLFFREEIRSGYRVSEQMKRVWACQLDLLKRFLEVCDKYNLKCWAEAGTLLGAVRHKGYIPWDDDIDMVMFREDYERLQKVASTEFRHPYFFQTIYSDRHYDHRHAQLRNSETSAIPVNGREKSYNQGIFIDIFIMDSYPRSVRMAYKMTNKVKLLQLLLKASIKLSKRLPDSLYRKWRWDIARFRKYETYLKSIPLDVEGYASCISLNFKERIREVSCYRQTEWMDFENIKIPVPAGYDRILTLDYGDYMTPVQAPTLHGTLTFDTETGYRQLLQAMK